MANTYYKYAERGAESQINWGEVGKSVSEMIALEAAAREKKKAAIDESSRQYGEVLSKAPIGDFKTAKEWTLNFADDAAQALLLLDRQLKTGQISVKDYTVKRQNLGDYTTQLFDLSKSYQDKYKEALDRNFNGDNSLAEMFVVESVEGLGNLMNTKAYINPTNYQVSVGKMVQKEGPDGQTVMMLDDNPNNYKTLHQMANYMNVKIDKYDYKSDVAAKIEGLGDYKTTDIKKAKGLYRSIEISKVSDPTKRGEIDEKTKKELIKEGYKEEEINMMSEYSKWEEASISSTLANPYIAQSILVDHIATNPITGEKFKYTWNEKDLEGDEDGAYILWEDDGSGRPVPKLTEKQEGFARDFMKTMISNAIDKVTETNIQNEAPVQYAPEYILARGDRKKVETEMANYWNQLYWGNAQQKNEAAQVLISNQFSQNKGLIDINMNTSGKITFKYMSNGNYYTITKDLNSMDPTAWATAASELTGVDGMKGMAKGKTRNTDAAGQFQRTVQLMPTGDGNGAGDNVFK